MTLPRLDLIDAYRNKIINGDMTLWQRGTTTDIASGNASIYLADRFKAGNVSSAATLRYSRSTAVPTVAQSGYNFRYSARLSTPVTADASMTATDLIIFRHVLEGYDYQDLHGGVPIAIQFWARANKTGTFGFSLENDANDRNWVKPLTISAADTWQRFFVLLNTDASGTWLFDSGGGLVVRLALMAGSNYQTSTVETWQAGNTYSTSAQTNFCDTTSSYFEITGVQLVAGGLPSDTYILRSDSVLPFRRAGRTFQEELAMAQRYYEKSFAIETTPVTAAGTVEVSRVAAFGPGIQGQTWATDVPFKVQKRAVPTIVPYNANSAANNWEWTDTNIATTTGWVLQFSSRNSFVPRKDGATSTFTWAMGHWTADAEL